MKSSQLYRSITWCIVPQVAFAFYAGGDWMPNSRYLVPVFPLVYVVGFYFLRDLSELARPKRYGKLMPAGILSLLAVSFLHQWDYRERILLDSEVLPYDLMNAGENAEPLGRWLGDHFDPSSLLATKRIGVVPYYSGLPTLDLYGLIDKTIAGIIHDGGSFNDETVGRKIADRVLYEEPVLVILHSRSKEPFVPHGSQEVALADGMTGDYEVLGNFVFSKTYFNRLYIRNDSFSDDDIRRLRDDFGRAFEGGDRDQWKD